MKWRQLVAGLAGAALLGGVQAGAQPAAPADETLVVGSVSELDLDQVQGIIERARVAAPTAQVPDPPGATRLTLEEALVIALQNNLQLQILTLDRDAAEHEVPATRARFHPTPGFALLASEERLVDADLDDDGVSLEEGTERTHEQLGVAFVRQEMPTGGSLILASEFARETDNGVDDTYEGGLVLELRQPLLRGGRTYVARREILDAEYDLGVLQTQLEAEMLRVGGETREAYYNTILAQRLIEVSEKAVQRDEGLVEASAELFRAGRATKRDVVSADIRLADDLAELARRRGDLQRSELELRDVLGVPIVERVLPSETTVPFRPVAPRLHDWIAHALRERPEIRGIEIRLAQSDLNVRNAANAVLPRLDAFGLYRRNDFAASFRRAYGFDSQTWVAGLEFEIPFGNVAAKERLRRAEVERARVERELVNQRRVVELEVRAEEIELRERIEELSAQTAKVEQARDKLEIALARYRAGVANNFDIIDAQEDLVESESDLLSAIVAYVNALVRLEARVAGPI